MRSAIEQAVPHGRSKGRRDNGAWGTPPTQVDAVWKELAEPFGRIAKKYPHLKNTNNHVHLGTLGTGSLFIEQAKEGMRTWHINPPHRSIRTRSTDAQWFVQNLLRVR